MKELVSEINQKLEEKFKLERLVHGELIVDNIENLDCHGQFWTFTFTIYEGQESLTINKEYGYGHENPIVRKMLKEFFKGGYDKRYLQLQYKLQEELEKARQEVKNLELKKLKEKVENYIGNNIPGAKVEIINGEVCLLVNELKISASSLNLK